QGTRCTSCLVLKKAWTCPAECTGAAAQFIALTGRRKGARGRPFIFQLLAGLAAAFFFAGAFLALAFGLAAVLALAGAFFFAGAFFLAAAFFFGFTLTSISLARFSRSFSYWEITLARLWARLAVALSTLTSASSHILRASLALTCLRASSTALRARSICFFSAALALVRYSSCRDSSLARLSFWRWISSLTRSRAASSCFSSDSTCFSLSLSKR